MRSHHASKVAAFFAFAALLAIGAVASAQSGLEKSKIELEIPVVQGSITVDGVLNENVWNNAAKISIPEILYTTVDEADLSGEVLVFWNASGLFAGFRVTDDQLLFAGQRDNLWAFDSVSLWLNNLWIQVGLGDDGNPRAQLDVVAGFPRFESAYDVAISRSQNGYVVELFVPARVISNALGIDWVSGTTFAFAAGLADRDEGDRTASTPRYFPNWFGWNNLASMATATLK